MTFVPSSRPVFFFALLTGLLCQGCASHKPKPEAPPTPTPPPIVRTVQWLPLGSCIAMLPIDGKETRDMDSIFRSQLIGRLPFQVVSVTRPELQNILHREQISSSEAIPPVTLRALREKYAANALLFTEFTVFRPYQPITIGVRSKLVSMDTLEVLWAADRVFNAADPATAEAAVRFADPTMKTPSEQSNQVILQSPRRFAEFVAHEIYATLPVP